MEKYTWSIAAQHSIFGFVIIRLQPSLLRVVNS